MYVFIEFFKFKQEFVLFENLCVADFYEFHVMEPFRTELT